MSEQQTTLKRHFSKEELIKLCHSRIPQMRYIVDFGDSNLIAPLPIWSPVPEKYQRTAHDSFSIWGLEAQPIKWLPIELQKFAYYVKRRSRGKRVTINIGLKPEAYKNNEGG